jgi:hypothetical protein
MSLVELFSRILKDILAYARVPVANEVTLVARELLANAVVHGNRMDPHKKTTFTLEELCGAGFSVTVKDEGQGFDFLHMDPPGASNGFHAGKRGYVIIRNCAQRIVFSDNGSAVSVFVGLAEIRETAKSYDAIYQRETVQASGAV